MHVVKNGFDLNVPCTIKQLYVLCTSGGVQILAYMHVLNSFMYYIHIMSLLH